MFCFLLRDGRSNQNANFSKSSTNFLCKVHVFLVSQNGAINNGILKTGKPDFFLLLFCACVTILLISWNKRFVYFAVHDVRCIHSSKFLFHQHNKYNQGLGLMVHSSLIKFQKSLDRWTFDLLCFLCVCVWHFTENLFLSFSYFRPLSKI